MKAMTETELVARDDMRPEAVLARASAIAERCAANAASVDYEGGFPTEEFGWLHRAGLLQAPLRRDLGGAGLGTEPDSILPLLHLLKEIGRGNLSVGRVYEGHVNALWLVQTYGTEDQIAAYAADARAGHVFAVWNTEAADGVKITPQGNGRYVLQGAKTFGSGASYVTRPFVNGALPDGGWQMCIVPMERVATSTDPSWWQPLGMRASASFKVDFTGVEVDDMALIGSPGEYTREPWFSGGAIRFAAVQLGGAEALFDATRTYLQSLKRTDDPYQRMRIGEMAIQIESGALWLAGAARAAQQADAQPAAFLAYTAMMRTAIEQICTSVMDTAARCVGARGLLRPYPMERMIRDLMLYLRQPAPDAALARVGAYALERTERAGEVWP